MTQWLWEQLTKPNSKVSNIWSVGQIALHNGKETRITRIDNHCYPICLLDGTRVKESEIRSVVK